MEPERPRRSHKTDWMALLCAVLFIGIGVRYIAGHPLPDPVVMFSILVVGLGLAGFAGILTKAFRKR